LAVTEAPLFHVAPRFRVATNALARMGHHWESGTPEYEVHRRLVEAVATEYANDGYNRARFMCAAGIKMSAEHVPAAKAAR
jgi:hypothetical protein